MPVFPAEGPLNTGCCYEAFIFWSTTNAGFRNKKCTRSHKEATNSSMFLKLKHKGKNTDTGEHTIQHNPPFQHMCRNSNPDLLETNMLLWTSKSSWTLYRLAHWGKETVWGRQWHNSVMDSKDPAVGWCILTVLRAVISGSDQQNWQYSPIHREDLSWHCSSPGPLKPSQCASGMRDSPLEPRGEPQWNSHFPEESLPYGLYSDIWRDHLTCFLSY